VQTLYSKSETETEAIGARLASFLRAGDFIALSGDLGSGKTCFVRGVAAGLEVPSSVIVTSPTYALLNVYQGRLSLYHFDLYRLDGDEIASLGFEEYFHGDGVCLVEWADRLLAGTVSERLEISFSHEGNCSRRLQFYARGERWRRLVPSFLPQETPDEKNF
jgi:tRNA threonylcarbamoyladenosine biosynthesis protein TsaE